MTKHKLNSEPGEGEKIFKNYMKINNENYILKNIQNGGIKMSDEIKKNVRGVVLLMEK